MVTARARFRNRYAAALAAALVFAASPALAGQSGEPTGTHTVADPGGHYTISFPASWDVVSMRATPLAGDVLSEVRDKAGLFSVMVAVDPHLNGRAMLMVMGMPTDHTLSPRTFGMMTGAGMKEGDDRYTMVREGEATIARRPAFYRYFTYVDKDAESIYMVMVYFTVGKTGYMVVGAAPNDPSTVTQTFGQISRILETFHPTGH